MHIDWIAFAPAAALGGGLLVGLSTALFLLGDGRIAGISGILAAPWRSVVSGRWRSIDGTRAAFLAGLVASPWLWRLAAPLPSTTPDVGHATLLASGVLVGVGVRLANGCTSGHGVCGLSRGSMRSLANVIAFMAAGAASVFVVRHGF